MASIEPDFCYLCGKALCDPTNDDHVPPKQLFTKSLRRQFNPSKLQSIKVHLECNASYQIDEDYFVTTLAPFAPGSIAGDAIFWKVIGDYQARKNRPLVSKVLGEFEEAPSGIILPKGRIAKRMEGKRISRVAWKIVRGKIFLQNGIVYPEDWTTDVTITPPGERPPDHFVLWMQERDPISYGEYPGVFAYRFEQFEEVENMHLWAMLLWDRIIITVSFHDRECKCDQCRSKVASVEKRGR